MSLGEGREETPPRGGRDETARQIRAPRSHLVHAHARVVRIATEAHAHHALLLRENRLINRPSVPQVRKKERHRPADGRATDNAGGGGEKVHHSTSGRGPRGSAEIWRRATTDRGLSLYFSDA